MEPSVPDLACSVHETARRLLAALPDAVFADPWWDPGAEEHAARDLAEQLRILEDWQAQGCPAGIFERTQADLHAAEMFDLPSNLSPAHLLAGQVLVVCDSAVATWALCLGITIDATPVQHAREAAVAFLDARPGLAEPAS